MDMQKAWSICGEIVAREAFRSQLDAYVDAHDDKRRNHLVWRGDGAGSFKFGDNDAAHRLKVRIPVREGSFLIWDQRVCHGSAPNDSDT